MSASSTPGRAGTPAVPSNWNIANALTTLRLLLVPVFGWLLLAGDGQDTTMRWWALAVFLLAAITDRFDGDLARRWGLVTDFGKICDPIADKALMGMAFVGLSMLGELWWWVTAVVILRELGITLMRFWVIRHGVMAASRGGKLKTVLQTVALSLYVGPLPEPLMFLAHLTMAAAVAVTLVTGVDYVVKAVALRREGMRSTAT
jgi:CDP-diacylglycerol--glycerol-3-phosphate 3-phosphatidyltransferase